MEIQVNVFFFSRKNDDLLEKLGRDMVDSLSHLDIFLKDVLSYFKLVVTCFENDGLDQPQGEHIYIYQSAKQFCKMKQMTMLGSLIKYFILKWDFNLCWDTVGLGRCKAPTFSPVIR